MAPEDARGHPYELIHTVPVHYALDSQKGGPRSLSVWSGAYA